MKIISATCLFNLIIVIAVSSCRKDPFLENSPTSAPEHTFNTAPKVSAGADVLLIMPNNSMSLNGHAEDKESNIVKYKWRKIEGPPSYLFADSTQLSTQVTDLVKGYYAFEITVTDAYGQEAKSTIRVVVADSRTQNNAVYFTSLVWDCFWECEITINDYNLLIPANSEIVVFVKRSNKWVLTGNRPYLGGYGYSHSITNNNLYIYGNDGTDDKIIDSDSPDIKIVY